MQAFAAMCSHVPNKGEQMVRYYGYSVSQLPTSDKWLYVDPEYPETFPS